WWILGILGQAPRAEPRMVLKTCEDLMILVRLRTALGVQVVVGSNRRPDHWRPLSFLALAGGSGASTLAPRPPVAKVGSLRVVLRNEWKTMPFFGSGRIQSARRSFGQRRFALPAQARRGYSQAAAAVLAAVDNAGAAQSMSFRDGFSLHAGCTRTRVVHRPCEQG